MTTLRNVRKHLFIAFSIIAVPTHLMAEEKCLKGAWAGFNQADYKRAIKYSDQCIDNFKKMADREEENLEKLKEPMPQTGTVSQSEKSKIFNRGLLNDVASACYIKGRSAEYLYKKGGTEAKKYKIMAISSYEMTRHYKYARTWDPQGFFWSPSDAAVDRLPLE